MPPKRGLCLNDDILGNAGVGVAVIDPKSGRVEGLRDNVATDQHVLLVMEFDSAGFVEDFDAVPAATAGEVVFDQPAEQPQALQRADTTLAERIAADDMADTRQFGRVLGNFVGYEGGSSAEIQPQAIDLQTVLF